MFAMKGETLTCDSKLASEKLDPVNGLLGVCCLNMHDHALHPIAFLNNSITRELFQAAVILTVKITETVNQSLASVILGKLYYNGFLDTARL